MVIGAMWRDMPTPVKHGHWCYVEGYAYPVKHGHMCHEAHMKLEYSS